MISRATALGTLLVLFLLPGAAAVLLTTGIDLVWFRDVGYPDSASLLRIGDYVHTGTIYPDPDQPPYLPSLYGPLFYILLSGPYRLAHDIDAMRIIVRLAMLAFWALSLALVFLIARHVTGSAKNGAWAILFACAPALLGHWTTQVRCDLLGTTFSLLAIYFVLGPPRYKPLLLGAACSVLALLCKPTFVAAPSAVIVSLLFWRRYRETLAFTGSVAIGLVAGYGVVFWKEPYAWRELTMLANSIFRPSSGMLLAFQGIWNAAPAFALLGVFAAWRRGSGKELPLTFYCLFAWVVALSTVMQIGGSINYFLEPLTASAALASVTLPEIADATRRMSRKVLIPVALALLLLWLSLLRSDFDLINEGRNRIIHYAPYRADWKAFSASITNRALLSSFPDVTIYSRSPEVPDPLLNSVLAARGVWSWRPVIQSLNRSDYELLAMYPYFLRGSGQYRGFRYWNASVFDAILRNYQLAGLCAGAEIWTPRHPRPDSWQYLKTEGCN